MWDRSVHKLAEPPPPMTATRDNRYIFNGDRQQSVAGYAVRQNRRGARKRFSTFNVIIALFATCILIVLYINNTIAVNELLGEINTLQGKYQRQIDMNAALQAEVNRKSSLERIGRMATEKLGMLYPRSQPVWFETPDDLRDRAAEVRKEFPE
jgi:cell division protein FtsL